MATFLIKELDFEGYYILMTFCVAFGSGRRQELDPPTPSDSAGLRLPSLLTGPAPPPGVQRISRRRPWRRPPREQVSADRLTGDMDDLLDPKLEVWKR